MCSAQPLPGQCTVSTLPRMPSELVPGSMLSSTPQDGHAVVRPPSVIATPVEGSWSMSPAEKIGPEIRFRHNQIQDGFGSASRPCLHNLEHSRPLAYVLRLRTL
jgi:hypothetical protein